MGEPDVDRRKTGGLGSSSLVSLSTSNRKYRRDQAQFWSEAISSKNTDRTYGFGGRLET
jgi:hypothetical protein